MKAALPPPIPTTSTNTKTSVTRLTDMSEGSELSEGILNDVVREKQMQLHTRNHTNGKK